MGKEWTYKEISSLFLKIGSCEPDIHCRLVYTSLDYKIIQDVQRKTTFNSDFIHKKNMT